MRLFLWTGTCVFCRLLPPHTRLSGTDDTQYHDAADGRSCSLEAAPRCLQLIPWLLPTRWHMQIYRALTGATPVLSTKLCAFSHHTDETVAPMPAQSPASSLSSKKTIWAGRCRQAAPYAGGYDTCSLCLRSASNPLYGSGFL